MELAGEQTLLRLVVRSREVIPRLNGRIPAQQTVRSSENLEQTEGIAS